MIYLPETKAYGMKVLTRHEMKFRCDIDILDKEMHHQHQVFEDMYGELRWVPNETYIESIKDQNFNDVVAKFIIRGLDKNCEEYRKAYRDIGYSLKGYWEVFFWDINNPIAAEYIPNSK